MPATQRCAGRASRTRPLARALPTLTLALLAAVNAACAQTPKRSTPEELAARMSDDAVLLVLPDVAQDELHECGLAAVTALCAYYRTPLDERERTALAQAARERDGLSGAELRDVLTAAGHEVYIYSGTLGHGELGLYRHVDRGRPPLVMIAAPGGEHHYCLFVGYDARTDSVALLDPLLGWISQPTREFETSWKKAQRFTLLCVPTGGSPRPSIEPAPAMQELSGG